MSEGPHMECLRFIQDEFRCTANPLVYRHTEKYTAYLTRVEASLTPSEKSFHAELKAEAFAYQDRCRPKGNSTGDYTIGGRSMAPISVPLERRMQTAVTLVFNFFTGMTIIAIVLGLLLYFSVWGRYLVGLYIAFQIYDQRQFLHPSFRRISQRFRKNILFTYLRDYYPIRLVCPKDIVLDPKRNYLFGYHPHGVQGVGAFSAFATDSCNASAVFPGIYTNVQTLPIQFHIPIWREMVVMTGCGDASKKMITQKFKQGPGHSTVIVVGGAAEAMLSAPGTARLVLRSRKGFVKLAIQSGADLVPVFSFGENDVYQNLAINRPWILSLQRRVQKIISFAPLFIQGRGIFNYSGGLLPHRRPIYVVAGRPIAVTKTEEPSADVIDSVHQRYMMELKSLFERYQPIFDPDVKITFE